MTRRGTLSFVDEASPTKLGYVNAIPDLEGNVWPKWTSFVVPRTRVAKSTKGGDRFVDDIAVSLDGKTAHISRSNPSDVVAIDLSSPDHRILWRFPIPHQCRPHGLQPLMAHIAVSATSDGHFFVIDTATGKQVTKVPTGSFPHQNDYSPDGKCIYNTSIGVSSALCLERHQGQKADDRGRRQDLEVVNKHLALWYSPQRGDPRWQDHLRADVVSERLGKVDMATGKVLKQVEILLSDYAKGTLQDQGRLSAEPAFHGMAINGAETKLCWPAPLTTHRHCLRACDDNRPHPASGSKPLLGQHQFRWQALLRAV